MAFFYLLLILLLLFGAVGAVVYFFTDMASRMKYTVLAALLLGWLLVAGYSYYQNKRRLFHDMLLFEYNHGAVLVCNDPFGKAIEVNKNSFEFVNATMIFMGKEGSRYEGLVVPLDKCRLKGKSGSDS